MNSAALKVGKSKTAAGTDRVIPLNSRAHAALNALAVQFPDRCDKYYVFPSEKYGWFGDEFKAAPTIGIRHVQWVTGRKHGKPQNDGQRLHADSMIYATQLAPECSRAEFPIQLRQHNGVKRSERDPNVKAIWLHRIKAHLLAVACLEGPVASHEIPTRGPVTLQ